MTHDELTALLAQEKEERAQMRAEQAAMKQRLEELSAMLDRFARKRAAV
jgi:hypothetical protein